MDVVTLVLAITGTILGIYSTVRSHWTKVRVVGRVGTTMQKISTGDGDHVNWRPNVGRCWIEFVNLSSFPVTVEAGNKWFSRRVDPDSPT